jgi:hypothetical protein
VVAAVGAVAARTEEVWHAIAVAARRHTRGEAERLRTCGRHVALATRQGLVAADRELGARSARVARAADVALTRSRRIHETEHLMCIDHGAGAIVAAHPHIAKFAVVRRATGILDDEPRCAESC